jgi:hypothetical protein
MSSQSQGRKFDPCWGRHRQDREEQRKHRPFPSLRLVRHSGWWPSVRDGLRRSRTARDAGRGNSVEMALLADTSRFGAAIRRDTWLDGWRAQIKAVFFVRKQELGDPGKRNLTSCPGTAWCPPSAGNGTSAPAFHARACSAVSSSPRYSAASVPRQDSPAPVCPCPRDSDLNRLCPERVFPRVALAALGRGAMRSLPPCLEIRAARGVRDVVERRAAVDQRVLGDPCAL